MHHEPTVWKMEMRTTYGLRPGRKSRRGWPGAWVFMVLCFAFSLTAWADIFDWMGADGEHWDVLTNWKQDGAAATRLPTFGDDVLISANGANRVIRLENTKVVGALVVQNMTLRPSNGMRDIDIIAVDDMYFDNQSVLTANPGTPATPPGGRIDLLSIFGALDTAATLTAGAGDGRGGGGSITLQANSLQLKGAVTAGNSPRGDGGDISLRSDGDVSVTKPLQSGAAGGFGGRGGKITIQSQTGGVTIDDKVSAGGAGLAAAGGGITIVVRGGTGKVKINARVEAGTGGSVQGGAGGTLLIQGWGANGVELTASATIKAGDGGTSITQGLKGGPGGKALIDGNKYIAASSAEVYGGTGGKGPSNANGGTGGDVSVDIHGDLDNQGLIQSGDGGTRRGKPGDCHVKAKRTVRAGKVQKGTAGGEGTSGGEGAVESAGDVALYAEESVTVVPDDALYGRLVSIEVGPGGRINLQGLPPGTIQADFMVRIEAGEVDGPIDLQGAQSRAILAGAYICLYGQPLLDGGVTLADLTAPEADTPSTPCPVPPDDEGSDSEGR